jgi:ADP-ribose pyrophosphatase YjhB (NUDIX family)
MRSAKLPNVAGPEVTSASRERDVVDATPFRRFAIALAANSQGGLAFAQNEFDVRRFRAIGELASELFSLISTEPTGVFTSILETDVGYATPKVDVRGALFDDDERILLVKERADGRWTLPGGWADPLDTPSGATLREVQEEAGIRAEVTKLVACWDREIQNPDPPLPVHVYKLFFLCRAIETVGLPDPLETDGLGWYDVDDLPDLSTGRVTAHQIERLRAHRRDPGLPTEFD